MMKTLLLSIAGLLFLTANSQTNLVLHFEQNVHQHVVPGIDDRESHLYREYDINGRINEAFYQRAALAGIKNLETNSFNRGSSIDKMQSRFPEKYSNPSHQGAASLNPSYSSRQPSAIKNSTKMISRKNFI